MDVAQHHVLVDDDGVDCGGRPLAGQCRLYLLRAEGAVIAGAGDGDADAVRAAGDEGGGQRVARGGVAEFFVGRLLRRLEGDPDYDLTIGERSREQALEEIGSAMARLSVWIVASSASAAAA